MIFNVRKKQNSVCNPQRVAFTMGLLTGVINATSLGREFFITRNPYPATRNPEHLRDRQTNKLKKTHYGWR